MLHVCVRVCVCKCPLLTVKTFPTVASSAKIKKKKENELSLATSCGRGGKEVEQSWKSSSLVAVAGGSRGRGCGWRGRVAGNCGRLSKSKFVACKMRRASVCHGVCAPLYVCVSLCMCVPVYLYVCLCVCACVFECVQQTKTLPTALAKYH